jgi:hypothetical protein
MSLNDNNTKDLIHKTERTNDATEPRNEQIKKPHESSTDP